MKKMLVNNCKYYLPVVWGLILIMLFSQCGSKLNVEVVRLDNVKFNIPPHWRYEQLGSNKCEIINDTIKIILQWNSDSELSSMHLRNELEYLTTEDPNVLTNFAFNEPGIIYTNKENVDLIKRQEAGSRKLKIVKENPKAVLERSVKIEDSTLLAEGIDYLCRFRINGERKWIPIKLPDYFKKFRFETDSMVGAYYKLYYPINGNAGRCGLLIKNSKYGVFSARSSLIKDKDKYFKDVLAILKSITFNGYALKK